MEPGEAHVARPSAEMQSELVDVGLLVLRVAVGAMMLFGHGIGKAAKLGADPIRFPDPLGVGAAMSLYLATFSELICAALLIIGLATRLAAVPFLITMLVAAFIFHGDDPWGKKEFALLYAVPALVLALTGPGRWSVDGWWSRRKTG